MTEPDELPDSFRPSNYIEKVSLVTGEVLDDAIEPRELLVQEHRDYHVVDVYARHLMSRIVEATGDEERVIRGMKRIRELGRKAAGALGWLIGQDTSEKVAEALFGLKEKEYYFRYRKPPWSHEEVEARVASLRDEAREALVAVREDGTPRVRIFLTGATGFLGKEILWQAARDPEIAEVVALARPKTIRDRETGEVVEELTATDRGERLLDRLWISDPSTRDKFRFVPGDITEDAFGLPAEVLRHLEETTTHVIHCAASVAFDDPYEDSFRSNVVGSRNALEFSLGLQETDGSPFVAHLAVETSYIHGRQTREPAREDEVVFPRNFYNNYYELTKAMASIDTERFMVDRGLRVVQLCPAIVIGESRAGNNRGDRKVVNAPVNVFGRAREALSTDDGRLIDRSKGRILARMATIFPGDPSAEINLIPVDRVVAGILAATKRPEAVGERIHLATDKRITSEEMTEICREELSVNVRLAEPTLHRNVTLPALSRLLGLFGQEKIASILEKLGTIFGGYGEWGQPVHEVGNDVEILGLPADRPETKEVFRMLCRHNRWVQEYGKVRDPDEIARRERLWRDFVEELEEETGRSAGALPAKMFREVLERRIDPETFTRRNGAG